MANPSATQWLPSGGVLVVAIIAAILAAVLVNVYIGYAESGYKNSSKAVFQLTENVDEGKPVELRQVKRVLVPKYWEGAFDQAIPDNDQVIFGKDKARRQLTTGEILWYSDFIGRGSEPYTPPRGYVVMTVLINADTSLGEFLQPGGYVQLTGDIEVDVGGKKEDFGTQPIMDNVQVKALGGSAEPVTRGKIRSYSNIQILVKQSQVKQLQQILDHVKGKKLGIARSPTPEGSVTEPIINKETLNLIANPRTAVSAPPN